MNIRSALTVIAASLCLAPHLATAQNYPTKPVRMVVANQGGETVPGYEADSWYVILTRAGTPRTIINRVNELSAKALNSPEVNAKLVGAGIAIEVLTPEQVGEKIRRDTERWARVVKAAGIQRQ